MIAQQATSSRTRISMRVATSPRGVSGEPPRSPRTRAWGWRCGRRRRCRTRGRPGRRRRARARPRGRGCPRRESGPVRSDCDAHRPRALRHRLRFPRRSPAPRGPTRRQPRGRSTRRRPYRTEPVPGQGRVHPLRPLFELCEGHVAHRKPDAGAHGSDVVDMVVETLELQQQRACAAEVVVGHRADGILDCVGDGDGVGDRTRRAGPLGQSQCLVGTPPDRRLLQPAVLVEQLGIEDENALAHHVKAKVPALDDAGVRRADRNIVDVLAATGVVHSDVTDGCRSNGRSGSWPSNPIPVRSWTSRSSQPAAPTMSTMLSTLPPSGTVVTTTVRSESASTQPTPPSGVGNKLVNRSPSARSSARRSCQRDGSTDSVWVTGRTVIRRRRSSRPRSSTARHRRTRRPRAAPPRKTSQALKSIWPCASRGDAVPGRPRTGPRRSCGRSR